VKVAWNRLLRGPGKRPLQKEEEEPAVLEDAGPTVEDVEGVTGHQEAAAAEAGRNGRDKRGGTSPDMEGEAAAMAAAEEAGAAEATAGEAGDRHVEAEAGNTADEDSEGSKVGLSSGMGMVLSFSLTW
jgi:hypothetical protein